MHTVDYWWESVALVGIHAGIVSQKKLSCRDPEGRLFRLYLASLCNFHELQIPKLKHSACRRELHTARVLNAHITECVDDLSDDGRCFGVILFHFI